MNIKKLTTLVAVGIVSLLSTFQTPTKIEAALTAPTSYDYSFVYNSNISAFNYTTGGTSPTSIALFNRTTDGAYYNYTHTFSNSGSHTNTTNYDLPDGLDITMTFNRSNTSWTDASPSYTGYYPTDTKIGANNAVGTIPKLDFIFQNNTNKNYRLYLDNSSTGSFSTSWIIDIWLDDIRIGTDTYSAVNSLTSYVIPSYFKLQIRTRSHSSQAYLDAWYLQDLGVSDAYQTGYDNGYNIGENDGYDVGYSDGLNNNPNILLNGFQAMVGILVNFFLMIVNLEVFGVSIMGIFSIVVLFVGIVWVLKLIRG